MTSIKLEDLPEPFLGRLIIEVIKEDGDKYLKDRIRAEGKVSDEFLNTFELPTMETTYHPVTQEATATIVKKRVPITRGIILKKAPDAFGKAFCERYGDVGYTPQVGDTIIFIANESSAIEASGTYHFVNDCDIQGYLKESIKVNQTEVINE